LKQLAKLDPAAAEAFASAFAAAARKPAPAEVAAH
jgi:hypothetical protein